MSNLLKKAPLHCFAAAILPLFLIYTQNNTVINIYHLLVPAVYILLIGAISFFVCFAFTGNREKSFFYTTFTIVSGFYFFSVIQYLISLIGSEYVRDIYCFAAWILLELAVLFLIRNKFDTGVFNKITGFLNIFFLLLLAIKASMLLLSITQEDRAPSATPEILPLEKSKTTGSKKINVYYFVLDECASSATLEAVFNYKNKFDDSLHSLGFFVCSNARAEYGETFPSMSSTLNMQRVNPDSMGFKYYTQNLVTGIYKKAGYRTEMSTSFYVKNNGRYNCDAVHDSYPFDIFENEVITAMLVNTAFRVPYKLLFFRHGVDYHVKAIGNQFKTCDSIAESKSDTPRFLYVHINSPHGPLVTDSAGTPDYSFTKYSDSYLSQLIYTQRTVLNTVKKILGAEKGNCIILIQSDHGIRPHSSPLKLKDPNDRLRVFNAFYFPDAGAAKYLNDSMKIINNFRIIMNYQFGEVVGMID
jgi:hypothetical protein